MYLDSLRGSCRNTSFGDRPNAYTGFLNLQAARVVGVYGVMDRFCVSSHESICLKNYPSNSPHRRLKFVHTHTLSLSLSLSQVAPRRQRTQQHETQRLKTHLNRSPAGGTLTVPRPRFAHGERRLDGGAPFCLESATPAAARTIPVLSPAFRRMKYTERGGPKWCSKSRKTRAA